MVFSNFTRSESGNIIFFKNSTPIEGVKSLKFYKDDSVGTFTKKEFRWSFDNNYWASWETLDQGNISSVNVGSRPYLFFEIRYAKSNPSSKVTKFSVDYIAMSAADLQQCKTNSGEIVPPSVIPIDYGGTTPCPSNITEVINATTLCGKSCDYYLLRSNHKGQQAISTITDLQKILNNLSGGIQNSITGGSGSIDVSIGLQDEGTLLGNLRTINFAGDALSASLAGDVGTITSSAPTKLYVDGSLNVKQATITGAASTVTSDDLTTNRVLVSSGTGKIDVAATTVTELSYVSGVTSAIQPQLNGKQATITGGASTVTSANLTANRAVISSATGKLVVSTVTDTQLGYVSGVTSAIQTQLNGKQATITGAATTITSSNLTASRVMVSDGSGKAAISTVTSTRLVEVGDKRYGENYQLVESNASSTSSATTPQTKVTMTTTNLPAGTYKIFAKWRFLHTSASNSAYFDITIGGTAIGTQTPFSIEPKDTTNVASLSGTVYQALSGVNTILLRYWNESSSTTISDASIELIRVS